MFYDLNVLWNPASTQEIARTLAFLAELGYNVVALNHVISGKFPTDLACQIPDPLPFAIPSNLTVLRRCTLQLSEPVANARLTALGANYDILALRPIDEKTLQNACSNLDSDLISLDLSQRLSYFFKFKMVAECVKRGIRFEICYSQGLLGDANARRNLISNATQLIRATRGGRGIIISSEAKRAVGCRGPWDAINLSAIWGLAQDRGYEAVSKQSRSVVVSAKLKRTGYRGIVDVVYGGEKPEPAEKQTKGTVVEKAQPNRKRKSEDTALGTGTDDTQISKREKKRRAKLARETEGKVDGAQ